MKKVKYLLLLGLFAIITTGCVKLNYNMDIKKDKSMDFSIIYAFDKSLMGDENSLKEEDMADAKKQGFEVTKYSEGNYEGFKLTKKIANIDEVSTESDVIYDIANLADGNENSKYIFKVSKGTDKNTYTAKFKFDANMDEMMKETDEELTPDESDEDSDETLTTTTYDSLDLTNDNSSDLTSNMDLSGLANSMDLSFNVNLPYSAVSSNATTKNNDNKNLSWKLGVSGEQTIEFTFELKNNESNNMMLYIGIGVAALIVILLLVVLGKKKNNKAQAVPVETNDTVMTSSSDNMSSKVAPATVSETEQNQEQ